MEHILHLEKIKSLLSHSLFLLGVEPEGGGEYILFRSHVFGDKDVIKNRQVGEKTDVLEVRATPSFVIWSGVFL